MLVNLKNVCVLTLKIPSSDVHSCLFHAITSKDEEMIGSHALELRFIFNLNYLLLLSVGYDYINVMQNDI